MTPYEALIAAKEKPTAHMLKKFAVACGESLKKVDAAFWSGGPWETAPESIQNRIGWARHRLSVARDDLETLRQSREIVSGRGGYSRAADGAFQAIDAVYMVFTALLELAGPWESEDARRSFAAVVDQLGELRKAVHEMEWEADNFCFRSRGY